MRNLLTGFLNTEIEDRRINVTSLESILNTFERNEVQTIGDISGDIIVNRSYNSYFKEDAFACGSIEELKEEVQKHTDAMIKAYGRPEIEVFIKVGENSYADVKGFDVISFLYSL